MADLESQYFSHYHGVYGNSSEFPEQALEEIPDQLRQAIDNGNANFFAPLKTDLPQFFRVLTNESSRIYLLESIWESESITGGATEHRSYCWGLQCNDTPVVIGIPVPGDPDVDQELYEPYFQALPRGLHGCYARMDGMAIPDPELPGPGGYDLPTSFNDWHILEDYCEDVDLPEDSIAKLQADFPGDDMRVYIRGSHNDLVLLNFTKKDKALYHVRDNDFDHYRLIPNPGKVLDVYFANAVKGFPDAPTLS